MHRVFSICSTLTSPPSFPPSLLPLQMLHQHLQSLYGGSPNVSFFKGGGTAQMGAIVDMPDNSSSGDVSLFLSWFPLVFSACAQIGAIVKMSDSSSSGDVSLFLSWLSLVSSAFARKLVSLFRCKMLS